VHTVLRRKDRKRALAIPEVLSRLKQAQTVLYDQGEMRSLIEHLQGSASSLAAMENIHLTAVSVCAIQLGISDRLQHLDEVPDWVMGCSLGDLARSVFSGLVTFEKAIQIQHDLFQTYQNKDHNVEGINLGIRSPAAAAFSEYDFEWIGNNGITPSRMSPLFIQLSVNQGQYEKLQEYGQRKNWRIQRAEFDFLLHATELEDLSDSVLIKLADTKLLHPRVKIFSSILNKPLLNLREIRDEARQILWKPLRWQDAIVTLQSTYNVNRFINIGPCRSLSALQRQISPSCRAIEATHQIQAHQINLPVE